MPVPQPAITEGRAEILRSARLPPRMVVEVAAMGKGLLLLVLAVVAEVSVRKAQLRPQRVHLAMELEAMALLLRASPP